MDNVLVGVISAVIALVAAFVTIYFSRKTLRLSALSARMQYFAELRVWARDVGDILSEAIHLIEIDKETMPRKNFHETQHAIKIKLSALIDQGRWFFPNIISDSHGKDKEAAFRGHRHKVLDALVFTYRLVKRINLNDSFNADKVKEELVTQKRIFVSEIQMTLDPKKLSEEFEKITGIGNISQ